MQRSPRAGAKGHSPVCGSNLIQCITDNCINFIKLANKDKFIWLMNNENKDILITLCSYIQNNDFMKFIQLSVMH
jgi:hypothetical protein